MSAYLCTPETIAIIADYGVRYVAGIDSRIKTAMVLLKENVRSVAYRYDLTDNGVYSDFSNLTPKQYKDELIRQLNDLALNAYNQTDNHAAVFAACRRLDYQSCERPDYTKSKACSLIAQIAFQSARQIVKPWA